MKNKISIQNEMNIGGLPPTKRFVYSLSLTFLACFIQVWPDLVTQ